jgi:epoxyqueuosine reductase QueG
MPKPPKELNSETVKEYAINAGASVVGIAASNDFGSAPEGCKPTDALEGCHSVVVLGIPVPQDAILNNPIGFIDVRNATNEKLNNVAKSVAKQIKDAGYKVKTVSGMSGKWVNGMQIGHISLKHAAELAGLGSIGRNYLLTNPEYGNLLWFSAVLTDAELTPDKKSQHTFCNHCNKCVEMCPAKALENPALFGKKNCANTMFKMVNKKWEIVCFLCRKECPNCFGV